MKTEGSGEIRGDAVREAHVMARASSSQSAFGWVERESQCTRPAPIPNPAAARNEGAQRAPIKVHVPGCLAGALDAHSKFLGRTKIAPAANARPCSSHSARDCPPASAFSVAMTVFVPAATYAQSERMSESIGLPYPTRIPATERPRPAPRDQGPSARVSIPSAVPTQPHTSQRANLPKNVFAL